MSTWSLSSDRLLLRGEWTSEVASAWAEAGVTQLSWDPLGAAVDPAAGELPGLRGLVLLGETSDDSAVEGFVGLTSLMVRTGGCDRELDLRRLTSLVDLEVDGRLPPEQLPELPISQLRWANWPARDLGPALRCASLRRLQLDGVRRLTALNPDQVTSGLEELHLVYGRGRVDPVGLPALQSLCRLSLESVRLTEVESLGRLSSLRGLGLVNSGDVTSLAFIRGLHRLESFLFSGGTVRSGDLSPLDDLPSLDHRYVQPRRGYNRRYVDAVAADEGE